MIRLAPQNQPLARTPSDARPELLSLTDALGPLKDWLGIELPSRQAELMNLDAPIWSDVIVEIWLPPYAPRWDVMGECDRPELLARGKPGLLERPMAAWWSALPRGAAGPSSMWFEWDVGRLGTACPAPLTSLCVADSVLGAHATVRPPGSFTDAARMTEKVCEVIGHARAADGVERLVGLLGERGELLHIADTSPRGGANLRLCFFVSALEIMPWLTTAGWRGPIEQLPEVLFAACPPWDHTAVQLELTPAGELTPYIGIESLEWEEPVGHAQVEAWSSSMRGLGIDAPSATIARWAAWAGTKVAGPGARSSRSGYMFVKTAYDGTRWDAKGYLGLRPTTALDIG